MGLQRERALLSSARGFLPKSCDAAGTEAALKAFCPESAVSGRVLRGASCEVSRSAKMSLATLVLIVLLFSLLGAVPVWPHSAKWGYWPSGLIALSIVMVAALTFVYGVS
jgi:hypothetical protein